MGQRGSAEPWRAPKQLEVLQTGRGIERVSAAQLLGGGVASGDAASEVFGSW